MDTDIGSGCGDAVANAYLELVKQTVGKMCPTGADFKQTIKRVGEVGTIDIKVKNL